MSLQARPSARRRRGLIGVVGAFTALLIAFGAAQADASFLGNPSEIAWVGRNNNVNIYMPKMTTEEKGAFFENLIGEHVDPNTNPSAEGYFSAGSFSWNFAWASGGNVWTSQPSVGPHSENLGIAPGTSPSTGSQFAFQANTGSLWVSHKYQGQGLWPGTSPSRVMPSGWVAFQAASTTDLIVWNYKTQSGVDTHLGMAQGTSPAIAEIGNGTYEVAFVANTGRLWTYCSCEGVGRETPLGVENGTSPDITENGAGGWVVAFQGAGSHHLWIYQQNGQGTDLGGGISPSTSPSITERSGITAVWEVAFHATKNDWLETYSPLTGLVTTEKVMRSGSSPSIAQ